nr:TetR family transcriptional regulator [Streptomyces tsukubensis NRRL18488]
MLPARAGEGLLFILGANALWSRAGKDTAPDAWRRGVAFILDGLRAGSAHPLPVAPLTPQQLYEIMGGIIGTRPGTGQ